MKKIITALAIAPVLFLGACASQRDDIDQSKSSAIEMGKSTIEDIKEHVSGGQLSEDDTTINGKAIHVVNYLHSESAAFFGFESKRRVISYFFFNDKLVGKEVSSRFDEDSTDFDVDKAKTVKDGDTKQQVIAKLGKPSGEFIYPLAKNPNDMGIAYFNTLGRVVPVVGVTVTEHEARFSLNDGKVDDVYINDNTYVPFELNPFKSPPPRKFN